MEAPSGVEVVRKRNGNDGKGIGNVVQPNADVFCGFVRKRANVNVLFVAITQTKLGRDVDELFDAMR